MASRDWSAEGNTTAGGSPFDAAPAGLRQQRTQTDWSQGSQGASPWLRPAWQTGGQTGTTRNAFNDDFFTRMYDQYNEEQKKTQDDPQYVSNLFGRKDFTGIVGWDQESVIDPTRAKTQDNTRSFRVGDIYDNGRRLGNVYDQNSGLSLAEANAMVAPHIFGDRAADKYKEADGDQQKLKSMILEQGKIEGQQVQAYATRQPYQQSVNNLLKEWNEDPTFDIANVAAGAVGGAVVGRVGGGWGMLAGGILGAIGSFMNRDEIAQQAAQAAVSTGLTYERQGLDAAVAQGISSWGAAAGQKLNVFSNLVSGGVDTFAGKWGDNTSEMQQARANGNIGANVATGITGFIDGMLTTGSKIGTAAYMTSMGAATAGTAYNKAVHDGEWDEVTGTFHKYETMEQRLAAAGSSTIDLAQTLLPGLLSRSNRLGIGGRDHVDPTTLSVGESTTVHAMDRAFTVTKNAAGKLEATAENKVQSLIGWTAPSTAINRLSVRAAAQADVLRAGGKTLGPNDLYQAATRIEQASVPWKLAMINGFGEAAEEVSQTYLNAQAVGWAAEPNEYLQAAIQGFAMGAGMSVGTRIGNVSQDLRMFHRTNIVRQAQGMEPISKADWQTKDRSEKVRLSTPSRSIEQQVRVQNENTMADMRELVVTSSVGLTAKEDAVKKINKLGSISLDDGALEAMSDILQFNNIQVPEYMVLHSAKATIDRLESRLQGLQSRLNNPGEDEAADAPRIQATIDTLTGVLEQQVRPLYQQYIESGDENALLAINNVLQEHWNGTPEQRQAVELVFSRAPYDNAGSFQMLLPQIDLELTRNKIDGEAMISQSLEKLLSFDTDGDKVKHMARYLASDETRKAMRLGLADWASSEGVAKPGENLKYGGSGFLNMAEREYEADTLTAMQMVQASDDLVERQALENSYDALVKQLSDGLGDAVRPVTLTNFRKQLSVAPVGAKQEFYRALAQDSGKLVQRGAAGSELFSPETRISLWIENTIQNSLESWRDGKALRQQLTVMPPRARGAQPAQLSSDLRSDTPVAARTIGQTAEERAGAGDPFRTYGQFAYNVMNSVELSAEGALNPDDALQAIMEWYTVLSRLRTRTQIQTVRMGGNEVIREARADLEAIADAYFEGADNPPASKDERLARVASLPFWDVSENQLRSTGWDMSKHMKPSTTIAEVLLKNAADRVSDVTPPSPGQLDVTIAYTGIKKARALQLLLGDIAPAGLMTKMSSDAIGQYSNLDLAIRNYTQLVDKASRDRQRQQWKNNPEYNDPDSMFRWFVDTIREAADAELAHGDLTDGVAKGRLADEDRRFHSEQVVSAFTGMQQVVRKLGLRGKELSPSGILKALEDDTRVFETLLNMFPPEMRISMILRAENGGPQDIIIPKFLLDILMETDAERAAMIYFNAMFDMDLDAHGDDTAPSNSWIALYQSLDEAGQDAFNDMRLTSHNVQSFVNQVNKNFAKDRPPMLAWRTDTTMFDPSSTRAGWQWSAPSAERRQAIKDANRYFTTRADTIDGVVALREQNVQYASQLLQDLKDPRRRTRGKAQSLVAAFSNRIQQGQIFSQIAIGPAANREFLRFAHRGFDPNSASKGVANDSIAQFGDGDIRRNMTSFGTQIDQALNAALVVNAEDLKFNPQMLTQRLRIQTSTGLEIDWDPTIEDFPQRMLEFFIADDGAYQGMLFDMINPVVYEENALGKAVQQYVLPKSLKQIVEGNFYKDILLGEGSRARAENDELLTSFVNSLTPENNVTRVMAQVTVARTLGEQARGELSQAMYTRLSSDTAKILRSMAGMTRADLITARDLLRELSIAEYLKDTEKRDSAAVESTEALRLKVEAYKLVAERTEAEYKKNPTEATNVAYINALQDYARAESRLDSKSIGEIMLGAFKIQWGKPGELVTRSMIRQYIRTFGPDMETTMTGKDMDVLAQYHVAPEVNDFKVFGDEATNQKQWNHLAKIVAAHNTFRSNGYRAASFIASPQVADLSYFDPTYSYLAQTLMADESGIFDALQQAKQAAGNGTILPTTSAEKFLSDLSRTILDRKLLGEWSPELVASHLNAERYLGSSGAPQQVAVGGMVPQNQIGADISANRTFEVPTADMARQYAIDGQALLDSLKDPYSKGLDGDPWILLENATVALDNGGPQLSIKDSAGVEINRVPLVSALQDIQGGRLHRAITHRSLADAVALELQKYKDQDVTSSVEFLMFHPADKPADPMWANNIYFDGTVGSTDAAKSLYAALYLENDAVTQRMQRAALDSIKGSVAIYTQKHERAFDEKNPHDLNGLIHDISKDIMETALAKDYYFSNNVYRAVYRMVRDRLVVASGGQILSTEQVLTGAELAEDARVVGLSRETLETLRGSTTSGHARHIARAPKQGGEAEPWTGVFTPDQLSRVPELGQQAIGVTEIGNALRSSDMLNNERVDTFKYKDWTANERFMRSTRYDQFKALRSTIKDARRETKNALRIPDINLRMLREAADKMEASRRIDDQTRDLLLLSMGDATSLKSIDKASSARSLQDILSFLTTNDGRAFVLDPRKTAALADDGYITSIRQHEGTTAAKISPTDDVIIVDLDGFEGNPEDAAWVANVRDELLAIREYGLTAILVGTDPRAGLDADSYMMDNNMSYERTSTGLPIYYAKDTTGFHKTRAAREASLTEGTVHPLMNYSIGALSDTGDFMAGGEGVLLDDRSDWVGIGRTISSNIVPTTGMALYGAPSTPEAGLRAQTTLQDLLLDMDYLAEQYLLGANQKITPAAVAEQVQILRPLVQKAYDNLDVTTGLPRVGTDFVEGDLILTFTSDLGAVAITRWGYDQTKVNVAAQDENSLTSGIRTGLTAADSIRFFGQDRLSADKATVHGGTISKWSFDPTFGWRAIFENDMTLMGAKMIRDGKKSRGTLLPENRKPTTPMMRKLFPGFYDNASGNRKKGVTRRMVLNARQGIFVFGWDANRTLANALGSVEVNGQNNWTAEQWANLSAEDRAGVSAQVRRELESYRLNLKPSERISDRVALADEIMKNDQVTSIAQKLISEGRGMSYAAAQAKATENALAQSDFEIEAQYLSAVLTYLRGDGAYVSQVLGAPGFDQDNSIEDRQSYEMPSALTEFIDVNTYLRTYVQKDMNARMQNNSYSSDGQLLEGWWIRDDWRVLQKNRDGRMVLLTLTTGRTDPTGTDDTESSVEANRASTDDKASNQAQSIAMQSLGLDLGYGVRDAKLDKLVQATSFERFQARQGGGIARMGALQSMTIEEQQKREEQNYRAVGYSQPFDRTRWSEDPKELARVNEGYTLIYKILGWNEDGRYERLVDSMVRVFNRAWHDPENPGVDELGVRDVRETLDYIIKNLKAGQWPTMDGLMPVIHADVVAAIADANTWNPDNKRITGDRKHALLTSALESMWYSASKLPANAQTEVDALIRSYEKYLTDGYWMPSAYPDVIEALIDPRGKRFVSSTDPLLQDQLERGNPYRDLNLSSTVEENGIVREAPSSNLPTGTKTEAARRRRQALENGRATGGLLPKTIAEIRRSGREYRDEVRVSTQVWRNAHALRTIVPQLNPLLWVWNPVDAAFRYLPAAQGSLLGGSSTGFVGRQIRNRVESLAKISQSIVDKNPDSLMSAFLDAFGIQKPYIDDKANSVLPQIIRELSHNIKFRSTIAQETVHRPDDLLLTAGDRRRQKAVDWASKMQDVSHGMLKPQEARMYIEGILEHERVNNPNVEAYDILLNLHNNPLYFKEQGPTAAHQQAVNRIQNVKGAKQTALGEVIDRVLIPGSRSSNGIIHFSSNMLLLLAKFRNFAISSGINILGGQGVDAAGAILLQTLAFKKSAREGATRTPTDYISKVLESSDIADLFIRSGMSHTGLFVAALALNSLGVTGDDEEERKRKRIQKLQGLGVLYDPRDVANDFRNRDAVFLDKLGILSALYQTPSGEGQPQRSPAQLHWTLNFFVAPAIGLTDFLQTGELYDLVHGFESAVGQMPLINTNYFWDAVNTSSTLYNAATNDVNEDPGSLTNGASLLIKTVGVLEKSLIESAFINEIVAAQDEYARNPWGMPEVDQAGNIIRDRAGVPELTQATDREIGPDGTFIDKKQTRTYEEGLIRSFTSNNQTAAFLATLMTGTFGKGGSFMRGDMNVSQTTLQKSGINNGDAEALIMSVWDPTNKRETLTRDGAERLVDSLQAGTIRASDPAFQNIFLTFDQRQQISESLQKKIYVEGVETLGLSDKDAKQRMWDIWNGPANNPYVTPLSDVVWSRGKFADENGIPWKQTTTYRQLNTTWAQGPDGKMWATGLARNTILGNTGIIPFEGAAGSGLRGNLGVDEMLNSTDAAAQINTGFRGLTRVDESLDIPDEKDILDAIKKSTDNVLDAIKDLNSDLYQRGNQYGGGYRYGGGGGGGGGGSYANNPLMPFLNAMRAENIDNIPQMYINAINVRRADIRRERFSTERGRLNQWQ